MGAWGEGNFENDEAVEIVGPKIMAWLGSKIKKNPRTMKDVDAIMTYVGAIWRLTATSDGDYFDQYPPMTAGATIKKWRHTRGKGVGVDWVDMRDRVLDVFDEKITPEYVFDMASGSGDLYNKPGYYEGFVQARRQHITETFNQIGATTIE